MKLPKKRRIAVALLALLIVASGAAAYTVVFTAGGGTTYEAGSGLEVTSSVDHGISDRNPFNDTSTIYLSGVEISSVNDTAVTVDTWTGTTTTLSSIDATNGFISIDPNDKSAIVVDGGVTAVSWETAALDGTSQINYTASGSGTITATGLPSSTDYAAATTGGTVLTTGTTTADGEASISVNSATDEGIVLLEPSAPTLSNAEPADGAELTSREQTFSIDTEDADFATDAGDELNASLYINDEYVDSDTLTSNGTASVTTTLSMGGDHDYYWIVTDAYGESTISATRTLRVPQTLTLRQETDPDSLVTDATVNVTAYYSGEVTRRNTSDGQLNLTGFPVDKPITVRVKADGYYTRTAVIESIYDQSNVFLLNDTVADYQIRYKLAETTPAYPASDTVLFVERDLELNGSVDWRVIAGDNFGIVGVPVNLVQDERYQLRIKNLETGQVTVLGKYTAIQSETVTLSPGSASIDITDSTQSYGWSVTQNETAQTLLFEYLDSENATDTVKLTVHERYNKLNVLIDNQTFTSNNMLHQYDMTPNETNTTWMAEIYVDRGDSTMHFREPVTGPGTSIIPANLAQVWQTSLSVFILLIAGMAFSMLHVGVGAIATALIGAMLWYVGLLAGVATGPSVALAIVVSVLYHYYQGGGY